MLNNPIDYLQQQLRPFVARRWSADLENLQTPNRKFGHTYRREFVGQITRQIQELGIHKKLCREWYVFPETYPTWPEIVLELSYQIGVLTLVSRPDEITQLTRDALLTLTQPPLKVIRVAPQVLELLRYTRPPTDYELLEHCPRLLFVFPKGGLNRFLEKDNFLDFLLLGRQTQISQILLFRGSVVQLGLYSGNRIEISPDDPPELHRLGSLVVQLLLLLQQYPEFLSRPTVPRPPQFSPRAWKNFGRVPFVLDATRPVRIVYETPTETHRPHTTRRSPIPHWRRGHWMRVWTGPKSGNRHQKLVWIPPILVRAYTLEQQKMLD